VQIFVLVQFTTSVQCVPRAVTSKPHHARNPRSRGYTVCNGYQIVRSEHGHELFIMCARTHVCHMKCRSGIRHAIQHVYNKHYNICSLQRQPLYTHIRAHSVYGDTATSTRKTSHPTPATCTGMGWVCACRVHKCVVGHGRRVCDECPLCPRCTRHLCSVRRFIPHVHYPKSVRVTTDYTAPMCGTDTSDRGPTVTGTVITR
jgi:hypothetical protein